MKIIAKTMILIGIILLLLPTIGMLYTRNQKKQMYDNYLISQVETQTARELMNEGSSDLNNIAPNQDNTYAQTVNDRDVIGLINIPNIDVEILLVEGVSDQALKYAAGHMPETALPGEVGNCSIAGHRSYTFGKYFNRLDELAVGDEIRLTYGTKEYVYEVYESFLVLPTEVDVVEPQGDEAVVTLITCHPVINPTHRLIVRGKLKRD